MISPLLRFLYLEINKRCNLHCQHCMFWQLNDDDKPNYLSESFRNELIAELHSLNPKATVVTCGGEPMLDFPDYFSIAAQCRKLGLGFFSVTNGTLITDNSIAEKIVSEGPTEITVSLNSHDRKIHDATRGTKGCFDLTVRGLRLLLEARRKLGVPTVINAMTILCEQNYRTLDAFYDFVLNDIKADKLKLNILQPTFGLPTGDKYYEMNMVKNIEELDYIIRECNEKYNLHINEDWIQVIRRYHQDVVAAGSLRRGWKHEGTKASGPICNTYERNVMVTAYGDARLCFNHCYRAEKLKAPGDLRKFWEGADDIRAAMKNCSKPCGISHSVRRTHATVKPDGTSQW